jgi:isopentenyldiphosphate isomerase
MSLLNRKIWTGAAAALLGLYMLYNLWSRQRQLELIDLSEDGRISRNVSAVATIDKAHSEGKMHRGVWLHIINEDKELLLLKRADSAVTCPATWNAPGEHTKLLESYIATAYRGLDEELWLTKDKILAVVGLTASPMLLELHYGPPLNKQDLQWTQSFLVRVKKDSISYRSAEASAMEWVPLSSIEDTIKSGRLGFCKVESFTYTSSELGADAKPTSFEEMLQMHTEMIRAVISGKHSQEPLYFT